MGRQSRRHFIVRTALGFGGYLAVASGACKKPESADAGPAKTPKRTRRGGVNQSGPGSEPEPDTGPGEGLKTLSLGAFRTLSAACERILPRDEDPGATDLGCAEYIDRALADPDVHALWGRPLIGGLPALDRQARTLYGGPFHDRTPDQQDALLRAWQTSKHSGESAFFEVLHSLTLEGAFGDPTYGGNKSGLGFLMVAFVPPPPMPGVNLLQLGGK
jgi:gluconate 2-dehydrogenase gamma chain